VNSGTPGGRRLIGRAAIITGAASGIGRASAMRFASEGASVAVADVRAERAQQVADEIVATGGRAIAIGVDVSDTDQVAGMVHDAHDAFGRLDVLFCNAATTRPGDVVALGLADWSLVMATNVTSLFVASKHAVPFMAAVGGGSIIVTSSVSGLYADLGLAAYAATKAAVLGLIRALAVDHAGQGIRANAIAPGIADTPPLRRSLRELGLLDLAGAAVPRGKIGDPDEIASVAAFLASDDASFVSGQTIVVDGAMTTRSHFSSLQVLAEVAAARPNVSGRASPPSAP
jgi:NAD(P)-dependent dehydrogenase (short-subunit alcohol dehydrogenase family)